MFLLIDKPKGITSHDVVYKVRKVTGEKKVGHAGTLDPNATGLLIIGVGRETTKRLGGLTTDSKKTYLAEIFLGEERETDDPEGKVVSKKEILDPPDRKMVEKVLSSFKGEIKQIPPSFSAIKTKGKKAYQLARKGKKVPLKERKVTIYLLDLISYKYPILEVEASVSSGTYIRSLARDIGKELGTGAYLRNLRRTKINKLDVEKSVEIDKLTKENVDSFFFKDI